MNLGVARYRGSLTRGWIPNRSNDDRLREATNTLAPEDGATDPFASLDGYRERLFNGVAAMRTVGDGLVGLQNRVIVDRAGGRFLDQAMLAMFVPVDQAAGPIDGYLVMSVQAERFETAGTNQRPDDQYPEGMQPAPVQLAQQIIHGIAVREQPLRPAEQRLRSWKRALENQREILNEHRRAEFELDVSPPADLQHERQYPKKDFPFDRIGDQFGIAGVRQIDQGLGKRQGIRVRHRRCR